MNYSLDELVTKLIQINALAEENENDQAFKDTIESLDLAIDEKINAYVEVIKKIKGDIKTIDTRVKELQANKKANTNSLLRMNEQLDMALTATGKQKIKTPLATVWKQSSKSVKILDAVILDDKYLVQQAPTVNKEQIKADLNAGVDVKGAEFEFKESIRCR